MKKAKQTFLEKEGDAWFMRNRNGNREKSFPDDDRILKKIIDLHIPTSSVNVLEIGCGGGDRLGWLKNKLGCSCWGIEPSAQAVAYAQSAGINAVQGTADQLPYDDSTFDIVIFGFCLYLCDRDDLFKIASEADRVLQSPGWLIIKDFYAENPMRRPYHHSEGIYSHKMDYRTLFLWHPSYTCYDHTIRDHVSGGYTDFSQEWVALSVLRKDSSRVDQ